MNSTAVQALNTERFIQQFTEDELKVLKNTVAKGTTNEEFAYFIQVCQHSGLNPFTKQIYCTAYDGKNGRQFLIDYYYEGIKSLARRVDGYKGMDTQVVCEKDAFKMKKGEDGEWLVVEHEVTFPRGKIIGCYSIARREGFKDVVVFTDVEQVRHYMQGRNGHMWTNNLHDMIIKHTGKRSAKDQYGLDLPDDSHEISSMTPIDVTPSYQQTVIAGNSPQQVVKQIRTGENEFQTPDQILSQKREEVRKKQEMCGMSGFQLEEFAMNSLGKLPKEMDARELIALSRMLDAELQSIQSRNAHQQASLLDDLPPELQ